MRISPVFLLVPLGIPRIRLFARRNSAGSTVGSARHVRDAEIAVWRDPYRRDGRTGDTRDRYSRFGMEARPWRLIKRPSGRALTVCLERRRRPVIYVYVHAVPVRTTAISSYRSSIRERMGTRHILRARGPIERCARPVHACPDVRRPMAGC